MEAGSTQSIKSVFCATDAWMILLRDVYLNGAEARPRGLLTKEIVGNTSPRVDMTTPVVTSPVRRLGYRFMAAEAAWILGGKNDVASISPYSRHIASFSDDGITFAGAYGPKIVEQLDYVAESLLNDIDTRQAVLDIWRPNPKKSKDIPCTLTVQWLVRNRHLHCLDSMRSSDVWLGWPYDTFNFAMLSAYLLLILRERNPDFRRIELGTLRITAGSSHLYLQPEADGANNIPYNHELIKLAMRKEEPRMAYRPLNLSDFRCAAELLEHLLLLKDHKATLPWLREIQK